MGKTKPKRKRKNLRGRIPPEGSYGRQLYEIRMAVGLTEQELADKLYAARQTSKRKDAAKSRSQVSRHMTGTTNPKFHDIILDAKALGVKCTDLFPRDDDDGHAQSRVSELRDLVTRNVYLMSEDMLETALVGSSALLALQQKTKEEN